jgi:hypothetical protein
MASIPAADPPDDDAWLDEVSPGVREGQLRAFARVSGVACALVGAGGAFWGALLTDSKALAVVCYVVAGLALVISVAVSVRAPTRLVLEETVDKIGNDIARELFRARPVLGRLAVVGTFVGAGLLAAGAATQGSTEPGGPGPTQVCLGGGLCGAAPTVAATPVPSP